MKSAIPGGTGWLPAFCRGARKGVAVGAFIALTAQALMSKPAPRSPQRVVSDWTHRHVLYPDSKDAAAMARIRRDPRWMQNWYLRHRENWWPDRRRVPGKENKGSQRDWSVPLAASPSPFGFEPLLNYIFSIGPDTGFGSFNTTNIGSGQFFATAGTLNVTGGNDVGTYSLYPGGPAVTTSPSGFFIYNNVIYPTTDPGIDNDGPLFMGNGKEINIFSNGADSYQFYDNTGYNNTGTIFTILGAQGGGQQAFPAKFVFDVTAAPSCTGDFVAMGIPANPASGGQANIIGVNNLYSCSGGPTVFFAYASGSGQVPASVVLSQNGSQIGYVENVLSGSSYFHVLTIGTTGSNGTSAAAAAVPGSGNNAVDQRVLLSPDGGTTNQMSTSAPFVVYTANDANDVAYVTTFSTAGTGSGYLYKIGNVFNGSAVPTIVWSVAIGAIPSTPVYDSVSNKIFFTDSNGGIDSVTDFGASASAVSTRVVANGASSENPVIVDSTNQMVYASFNSNGTNAVVVQAPTSLASAVSVAVGASSPEFTGPYDPDFNNAWYTESGTPVMYVAGTGTGTLPTLYSVGFDGSGVMNTLADATTAPLSAGTADSSAITEFYNAKLQKDYIFVGVTDNCIAILGGGIGGCVMSLDVTNGFPTVNAASTALAAPGGINGVVVDNDSSAAEASSIYYATKTGQTLVKATQSGLN